MRIGIDARPLCSPITGIGRYLVEVITALSQMPDTSVVLYVYKPIINSLDLGSVTIKELPRPKLIPRILTPFWWLYIALPQVLKKDHLDLFWSPRHSLPLWGKKKFPFVVTIHDIVCYKFPQTMHWAHLLAERLFMPRSIKRANNIITVSQATKDDVIKKFSVSADKISVIHSAPSLNKSDEPLPVTINKNYVLFMGTLEPRKNLERLLNAYLSLSEELRKQHQLVLVGGSGWKSEALQQKINLLGKYGQIVYLGYRTDAELFTLMQNALILAYPSLYEGFGLPLVDAMECGVPILTSTDPACREVAGEAAVYVDPFNEQDMTEKLQQLLTDNHLRQHLATLGMLRSQKFSWQKTAMEHRNLFAACIKQQLE